MPLGIVSDEEFEKELLNSGGTSRVKEDNSNKTYAPESDLIPSDLIPFDGITSDGVIIKKPSRGREEGDNNVPESLRKIIGEEAVINGRQSALAIANQFGISASSVSAYTKGATSTTTYDSPKPSIVSHINKSRSRAIKRASNTLNLALSSITQDKLDYADAKDLSSIAKDMSVVIKNLEPPTPTNVGDTNISGPQFVIYAPQFKKEDTFDVIQVNE